MPQAVRPGASLRVFALPGAALLTPSALGASTQEACAALKMARAKLVEMVDSRGSGDLDALKREVYASSARLEGEVGVLTGNDAARAPASRLVWEASSTRVSRRSCRRLTWPL